MSFGRTRAEDGELAGVSIEDDGRVPKLASRYHETPQRAVVVADGVADDLQRAPVPAAAVERTLANYVVFAVKIVAALRSRMKPAQRLSSG